jgi:hypothetical protein
VAGQAEDKAAHTRNEALQSIQSQIADLSRWSLQIALAGDASDDRKADMVRSAQDIIRLVERL